MGYCVTDTRHYGWVSVVVVCNVSTVVTFNVWLVCSVCFMYWVLYGCVFVYCMAGVFV